MKINWLDGKHFGAELLLNAMLLPLGAVCYPIGAWFAILLLPILHAALTYRNAKYATNHKRWLVLQLVMLAATELGIMCNSLLYFRRICYDYESVLVAEAEAGAAVLVVCVLSVIAFVWRKQVGRK